MALVVDSNIAYVTVEHAGYGCDCGCCGWEAFAYDSTGKQLYESEFDFGHGNGLNTLEDAKQFAAEHFPGASFNEEESNYNCVNF